MRELLSLVRILWGTYRRWLVGATCILVGEQLLMILTYDLHVVGEAAGWLESLFMILTSVAFLGLPLLLATRDVQGRALGGREPDDNWGARVGLAVNAILAALSAPFVLVEKLIRYGIVGVKDPTLLTASLYSLGGLFFVLWAGAVVGWLGGRLAIRGIAHSAKRSGL
jgi:hypothetical protein